MKIVIEVPEDVRNAFQSLNYCDADNILIFFDKVCTLIECVNNGQILPKGHGRLIDADELLKYIDSMQSWLNENGYRVIRRIILTDYIRGSIPTIIEADKEGAEE